MNSALLSSKDRATPDDPYSVLMPPPKPAEHRKERRYLINQLAQIIRAGGSPWSVRIRDISTRGMQVVVDQPVCAGPDIRIRWNDRDITGTVRYKRSHDAHSYSIGVELNAPSPTLVIDMLKKQSEEAQHGAFLVHDQEAVLQSYFALQDLASECPGLLPQPVLSPQRYGTLLNQAIDAMIVTSIGGTVLFWNKAAEQLYGWTMKEAVGRLTKQLYEAPGADGALQAMDGDVRHLCKDGSLVRVRSCSIIQQASDGEPEAVIFINRRTEIG
jgi:PAS domain S-box-containing protein